VGLFGMSDVDGGVRLELPAFYPDTMALESVRAAYEISVTSFGAEMGNWWRPGGNPTSPPTSGLGRV
jgi:hypothetical protein